MGIITRQETPVAGRCLIAEDGAPCQHTAWRRGICQRHYGYVQSHHLLDRWALPAPPRKHVFLLKPDADQHPETCRIIGNGEPCPVPAARRGLCDRHYTAIWQRPDLSLDDFALPLLAQRRSTLSLRSPTIAGRCRVTESGVPCEADPLTRGLCKAHYSWLRGNAPEQFERLAAPIDRPAVLTLRPRLRPGRCRVAEDGVGCGERAQTRGLCERHYRALNSDPDRFAAIAAPSQAKGRRDLHRKPAIEDGVCSVIDSGAPCQAPGIKRGVCAHHDRIIRNTNRLKIGDFQVDRQAVMLLKPLSMLAHGLCRAIVDGSPCAELPHSRGLCRSHYRLARDLGVVDAIALPPRTAQDRQTQRVPHAYLDKNVLFDWCDARAFGLKGQQASIDIVERVRANQMWATISATAVTSSYNHVRHRAVRACEAGGVEADEAGAEALARRTVGSMLTGPWRILSLDADRLRHTLAAPMNGHSYEDALEWAGYLEARRSGSPPTWFVTRDTDFPEGVRPWTCEEHLQELDQRR